MEIEMKDELGATVERLAAAAGLLEQAVERLAQRQISRWMRRLRLGELSPRLKGGAR